MTLKAHGDGRAFILPRQSAAEAALVREAVVYPADTLLQVCGHLAGKDPLAPRARDANPAVAQSRIRIWLKSKASLTRGRVLEITAAGRHSLLILCVPLNLESLAYSDGSREPGILILCPSKPLRRRFSLVSLRPEADARTSAKLR